MRGNFIAKYKYKGRSEIFSFTFGNKMQRTICKSLRSTLHTWPIAFYFPMKIKKKLYFNPKIRS